MKIERLSDYAIIVNDHIYPLDEFSYDYLDVTFYSRHRMVYAPLNYIGMCDLIDIIVRDDITIPLLHTKKNVIFYVDDCKNIYKVAPNAIGKLPPVSGKITGMFYRLQDMSWLNKSEMECLVNIVKGC